MNYSSETFPEGQIMCPYDKSHVLGSLRAISHLTKCRKRHPELAQRIHICPYNQTHHIPSEDMKDHFKVCQEYSAMRNYDTMECRMKVPDLNLTPQISTSFGTSQSQSQYAQVDIPKSEVEDDVSEWM